MTNNTATRNTDVGSRLRGPYRKPAPKVTILIGFTTDRSVILASDSRVSYASSTASQPNVQKVVQILTPDGSKVLLAKAGIVDSTDYFQEVFESRLAGATITSHRSVANIAEEALKETQAKLLAPLREKNAAREAMDQHLRNYDCEMVLGYVPDKTP